MKQTVLDNLNEGLINTSNKYKNAEMPEEMDKNSCIQMLSREMKLISDEEKRAFEQEMQKDRAQLEKDHKYWSEKFEENKFKEEVSNNKTTNELKKEELELSKQKLSLDELKEQHSKELDDKKFSSECSQKDIDNKFRKEELELSKQKLKLDAQRQDFMLKLEETKLKMEETRIEMERANMVNTERARAFDQKYRWISLGLSVGIPAVTTLVSILVYRKLAYANLKLIYVDEGRPTKDFGDACQSIKKLIK